MIKVCHMTSAHSNRDIRIFEKQCVSLAKRKAYDVNLVAPGEQFCEKGVNVIGAGQLPQNRIARMLSTTKKVYREALAVNADIYHFHDPELLPYGLKLKKRGKIVIFDSHEDVGGQIKNKTYIPRPIRGIVAVLYKIRQKHIVKKLDAVVTVTPHLYKFFKNIGCNAYMITNFPIVANVEQKCKCKGKKLIFAGGVTEQWSHQYIIEALADINDIHYDILGKADENYIEQLSHLDGWSKVTYHGFKDFETAQELIRSSSIAMVLCQYSDNTNGKEGTLGNTKIFEAMQSGIPVIATDFDLWKDFVEKEKCGICVNPSDVTGIRKAILDLINDIDTAHRMGENGQRLVKEKYNWGSQEEILYAMYEQIIKVQ